MFESLSHSLSHIFSKITGQGKIDQKTLDNTLERVKDALLHADVPYDVVTQFCKTIRQKVAHNSILSQGKPAERLMYIVHESIEEFLGGSDENAVTLPNAGVILCMGLQGSGKTTTTVKLAHALQKKAQGKDTAPRVLVASIDFYRPAAVEQLRVYADQADIDTYQALETDPVAAAQEIVKHGESAYDIIIIDTAGRLHVDDEMLAQVQEVNRRIQPAYRMLVLDAMTGQQSLEVARAFKEHIGFDGGILTKMDSDTRGGSAFAFRYTLNKPIVYCGTGEKIDDMTPFKPDRIARRILDMGDLLTLSEKAQEKIDEEETQQVYNRLQSGEFSLDDFAKQLRMMQRIGSFSQVLQYIPGASSLQMSPEQASYAETELQRFVIMMNSMTDKERQQPSIINRSRRERIARGAGVSVKEVQQLLDRFKQSKQMMKMMQKMGGLQQLFK